MSSSKKAIERPIRYLTKSLVRTAISCPRKLVYASNPKVYHRQDTIVQDPFAKHLAEEGHRFGHYCRRLFPHGVIIDEGSTDDMIAQTNHALSEQSRRVTIFEGAVRNGHFYIRPDILDKIEHNKIDEPSSKPELRVIEVKTKSYDSRPSAKKIWNGKKKNSIRANFLPYIQDVAFQSMVVRRSFPEYDVSSWLMLPDRGKIRQDADDIITNDSIPTLEETLNAIAMSTATLINVDKLAAFAMESKASFPGSIGKSFEQVVELWAEQFCYEEDLDKSFSNVPIGSSCASCAYRVRTLSDRKPSGENNLTPISGFDICWQNATGLGPKELAQPLIVDMYGYTKQSISKFIGKDKFRLSDLRFEDFQNKKDIEPQDKISSLDRQWYQVSSSHNKLDRHHQYVLKKDSIREEMEQWSFPYHFIDFETAAPVLPYYPGMAPYEVFAFQFSHHIIYEDGQHEVKHASEFLHREKGICPNEYFLRALYNAIGTDGTVFQWSMFETTVLASLLSSKQATSLLSSHEKESLSALLSSGSRRMVDLCKLASDYYYVNGSGGSSSIKRLLAPTLNISTRLKEIYGAPTYNSNNFREFQWYQQDDNGNAIDPYKILAKVSQYDNNNDEVAIKKMSSVVHGGGAATAFHELQSNNLDAQSRREVEKSLLRYCELDTLSMAMVVQAWEGFLDET